MSCLTKANKPVILREPGIVPFPLLTYSAPVLQVAPQFSHSATGAPGQTDASHGDHHFSRRVSGESLV